jgi:CRISPR-associated protein Cmr3
MSAVSTCFIEPLDVLFMRGNKLFGDPGSYGESLVPPWPSVAAGALRSRMLADAGVDLAAFANGQVDHPSLGTPKQPGTFAVTAFHLARRRADGGVEPLFAPPADLVLSRDDVDAIQVRSLTPTPLSGGEGLKGRASISCSAPLPLLPVLAETQRSKPESGYWLTEAGWRNYLAGKTPAPDQWVISSELWAIDPRVGVGLDAATRRAADGKLFSVQAVAMHPGVGFLAGVSGAEPPKTGAIRLGGDGRAAALRSAGMELPEPDYSALAAAKRCRLVLTTPGLFQTGWLPTGVTQDAEGAYRFALQGVKARLVCAAVPRAEVVSGWDLALWQPKPALRAAPTGAVYWLNELEATEDALRKLAIKGLWDDSCHDPQRRAEGFNRFTFAAF